MNIVLEYGDVFGANPPPWSGWADGWCLATANLTGHPSLFRTAFPAHGEASGSVRKHPEAKNIFIHPAPTFSGPRASLDQGDRLPARVPTTPRRGSGFCFHLERSPRLGGQADAGLAFPGPCPVISANSRSIRARSRLFVLIRVIFSHPFGVCSSAAITSHIARHVCLDAARQWRHDSGAG